MRRRQFTPIVAAACLCGCVGAGAADSDSIHRVTTRAELVDALARGDFSAVSIKVVGTIDVNVDNAGRTLVCTDYARDGYSLAAYLRAYDPATWGRKRVAGPMEDARRASQRAQAERVQLRVRSNTRIEGEKGAVLKGAWLDVSGATNVTVRNLTLVDTHDCFPQWDPLDGAEGNWNAEYDSISISGSTNVIVEHNTFEDRDTADAAQPLHFGKRYQVHDGALDVTNGSDRVTIAWNRFLRHDKVMLIGSSDKAFGDRGKLNVVVHHNLFQDTGQRTPRVRFGRVHVYNNVYRVGEGFQYAWGAGVESQLYVEGNVVLGRASLRPEQLLRAIGGGAVTVNSTLINGGAADVVAAYNESHSGAKLSPINWRPQDAQLDAVDIVQVRVEQRAGPQR